MSEPADLYTIQLLKDIKPFKKGDKLQASKYTIPSKEGKLYDKFSIPLNEGVSLHIHAKYATLLNKEN